jgi:hypothetical protein
MKIYLFLSFLTFFPFFCPAQINIALLHQLISQSKSEHGLQSSARDRQGVLLVGESLNRGGMKSLKEGYVKISSQLSVLGGAIDALQIGIESSPLLNDIYLQQSAIISLCSSEPLLIPLALSAQADLADQAQLLVRYLYGLALSIADLNQMRQSERKLLFFQVIYQLRSISSALHGICLALRAPLQRRQGRQVSFSDFGKRDQVLTGEILQKSRMLRTVQ